MARHRNHIIEYSRENNDLFDDNKIQSHSNFEVKKYRTTDEDHDIGCGSGIYRAFMISDERFDEITQKSANLVEILGRFVRVMDDFACTLELLIKCTTRIMILTTGWNRIV
jgi:hypothetical protein